MTIDINALWVAGALFFAFVAIISLCAQINVYNKSRELHTGDKDPHYELLWTISACISMMAPVVGAIICMANAHAIP